MKRLVLPAAFLGIVALASAVLAIGGGGGGSPPANTNANANENVNTAPSCTADTWSCSDWSSCSTQGTQTRTCTLTSDCAAVNTPKPAESQTCTPPVTNTAPLNTNTAASTNRNTATNRNASTQPTNTNTVTNVPVSANSNAPGEAGNANAATNLNTATNAPGEAGSGSAGNAALSLCTDLAGILDRVRCRLQVSETELARQQAIVYLPEECRALSEKDDQNACIVLYQKLGPCFAKPFGDDRLSCAQRAIGLMRAAPEEVSRCGDVACREALKPKVYSLIKFRLYDLEEEAERLLARGAPLDAVTDFVAGVEILKQNFNTATAKGQRREVLTRAQEMWSAFSDQVKPFLQ